MTSSLPAFAAIVVAAGSGSRAGEAKQWRDLGGQPVISWSVAALLEAGAEDVVVVVAPGAEAEANASLSGLNGWRLALEIAVVLLTFGLVFGLFMKMDEEKPAESSQKSATDYGFFRERLFWLTTALCFFYEAVEASMMGWLTTFYIDSGVLAAGAAQIVTSLLWISLLVGRFSCSVIAARFRPWQMITVMCFGIAAFLVLLVLGTSLPVLIVATSGLGLCMSGMYGTTVSNAGDLFSRYPASMGTYVTLNGLGAAAAPAAIGVAANHGGIRIGFALLLIAAAMLVVSALCNMRYLKKR